MLVGRGYQNRTGDLTPPRRARYRCAKPRKKKWRKREDHLIESFAFDNEPWARTSPSSVKKSLQAFLRNTFHDFLAEARGFEPPRHCCPHDFESCAFNHSATLPQTILSYLLLKSKVGRNYAAFLSPGASAGAVSSGFFASSGSSVPFFAASGFGLILRANSFQ